jgi:glutamate--cysteine ligase
MAGASASIPLTDEQQLVRFFREGTKPVSAWRVGAEHEKIGVYADGRAIPYEGPNGIGELLRRLRERYGGEPVVEGDNVIALSLGKASITLEPGGQLELSGATAVDAQAADREMREHVEQVKTVAAELGIEWIAVGFRPFGQRADVPWMPKGRYRVMREYLPTRGRLAHEMMLRTATVQANLDYADDLDAARKFRTAMGVSSLVTALYANSPIVDGKPSGFKTYRAAVWIETDPDRCGLLPFAFESDELLFERYAQWALDVPMFFVYRGGYTPAGGITFRQFMRDGFQGERATLADWELHLSTLFPEVRLKQYIEVRGADSGPLDLVRALPALWRGLLYVPEACDEAWRLVAGLTMDEREQLRRDVPKGGLAARAGGRALHELVRELVAIARRGAQELGHGEAVLLEPLERIAREGRVPAEHVLDVYDRTSGDPAKMIAALKY